jgi:hypothetical protein
MMTTKEITNQLESYAVASGYAYQLFYHDGWCFHARETEGGFLVKLQFYLGHATYQDTREMFLSSSCQQVHLIQTALELMHEATNNQEKRHHFASASELAAALESQVDRAFPGGNYAFGYFYREAWNFQGEDRLEGCKVWLNFQFDSETWQQTSKYDLPSALTTSELIGWTKTFMNEAFSKR